MQGENRTLSYYQYIYWYYGTIKSRNLSKTLGSRRKSPLQIRKYSMGVSMRNFVTKCVWVDVCVYKSGVFQISVKWKYPMYESAIINRDILARLYRTHSFCEANHISTNSNICLHLLWQQEALTITINKYFPAIGCLNYERSLKCVNKNCPQRVEVHCYFNYLRLGQNHIY